MSADTADVEIRALGGEAEARACATIMSTSEPWITLGRTFDAALEKVWAPDREVYVAVHNDEVMGFVVLAMQGAFRGYIQSVAVRPEWRSRGLGHRLLAFAESRIFRESPNVFICVSSFNPRARALYLRLGYAVVGELRDYIVRGHSEWLLRKTTGPIADFSARGGASGTRILP